MRRSRRTISRDGWLRRFPFRLHRNCAPVYPPPEGPEASEPRSRGRLALSNAKRKPGWGEPGKWSQHQFAARPRRSCGPIRHLTNASCGWLSRSCRRRGHIFGDKRRSVPTSWTSSVRPSGSSSRLMVDITVTTISPDTIANGSSGSNNRDTASFGFGIPILMATLPLCSNAFMSNSMGHARQKLVR